MSVELRQNSVAAVVLDAGLRPADATSRAPRRSLTEGGLAAIVLGTRSVQRGLVGAGLFTLAIALHAGAGFAALTSQSRHRDDEEPLAQRPSLQLDQFVNLEPPEPPPPPPAPPPPTKARAVEQVPSPASPSPTLPSEEPPPAAEAGQVVAVDESANQPLDFTRFEISTGDGRLFPGGITASSGTNSRAVRAASVDRHAKPNAPAGTSRARPVGPPRRDWDCPWPAGAAALSNRRTVRGHPRGRASRWRGRVRGAHL